MLSKVQGFSGLLKTLTSLAEILPEDRQVVVGRELTKKFETIYRGSANEVLIKLQNDKILGEFAIVVQGGK